MLGKFGSKLLGLAGQIEDRYRGFSAARQSGVSPPDGVHSVLPSLQCSPPFLECSPDYSPPKTGLTRLHRVRQEATRSSLSLRLLRRLPHRSHPAGGVLLSRDRLMVDIEINPDFTPAVRHSAAVFPVAWTTDSKMLPSSLYPLPLLSFVADSLTFPAQCQMSRLPPGAYRAGVLTSFCGFFLRHCSTYGPARRPLMVRRAESSLLHATTGYSAAGLVPAASRSITIHS